MTVLTMERGDTFTWTATIGSPTPVDLTGYTLWFTIKSAVNLTPPDPADANALVLNYWVSGGTSAGITVATPASGVAVVTVVPTITMLFDARRGYVFDLQMKDAAGATTTIDQGTVTISDDVTQRLTTP